MENKINLPDKVRQRVVAHMIESKKAQEAIGVIVESYLCGLKEEYIGCQVSNDGSYVILEQKEETECEKQPQKESRSYNS